MLTLFTTAKPFEGLSAIIQRNALKSWVLLHPDVEVVLFGDDSGAAEVARELGIRHVPEIARVPQGPKLLPSFFDAAQRMARHDLVCFANCDIIFTPDFIAAVAALRASQVPSLMIGRRWDTSISTHLPFGSPDWAANAHALALHTGCQCGPTWIDYFVFPKNFYLGQLPPFVIGRIVWDHWLVWKARSSGLRVVDASDAVVAIHQNHDYGYHPLGAQGIWTDDLAKRNGALAGSFRHLCTIEDATHLLGPGGLRVNPRKDVQALRRFARNLWQTPRLCILDWTRPMRHALGLRKGTEAFRVPPGNTNSPMARSSRAGSRPVAAK
jgi:hypothetical protein